MAKKVNNPVKGITGVMNLGQIEPGFARTEPLLTAEKLRLRYFPGIPLVSSLTGEEIKDETINYYISVGVTDFETSVRVPVSPVRIKDAFDFQRADDLAFSTRQLTRWPVLQVEGLHACFPGRMDGSTMPNANPLTDPFNDENSQEISYPTNWVETQSDQGLIQIVPKSGSLVNADISFIASTGYRSILLGGLKSWPRLWRITYLAGFEQDKIPAVVNHLIGVMAALQLLSVLGPILFPAQSYGISMDGMSQSTATLGPAYLAQRLQELTAERDRLINQLKSYYGTDLAFAIF